MSPVEVESPSVEEDSPSSDPADSELVEAEPIRESVSTVRELMDVWREQYDLADGEAKQELAYRIIKMGEALSLSNLHADEVKIREAESGVLGFYNPASGEIVITTGGLALPPEHFADVLVHEATHAGVTTGRRVSDEGLTQIITEQRVSGAMSGIYPDEQRDAQAGLAGVGIERAIDAYDFDQPRELIELYLQTEWDDAWQGEWKEKTADQDLATPESRRALMDGLMGEWLTELETNLEAAAPRLVEKAKAEGFEWSEANARFFEQAAKPELATE